MANENISVNNDNREMPRRPGAAPDQQSIGRFDLKNDKVSVINSAESDPTPAQELSEAYDDAFEATGTNSVSALDDAEEVDVADVDEIPMNANTGDPENPTDSAVSPIGDDENDFEYQQQMVEESGPDSEAQLAKEDVA